MCSLSLAFETSVDVIMFVFVLICIVGVNGSVNIFAM